MLASHLASAGCDIVVCGRALERIVMAIAGGIAEHEVAWAAEPTELPQLRTRSATKIHHTADVADWLAALQPGTVLLAAQNGVDHRARLAPRNPPRPSRRWCSPTPGGPGRVKRKSRAQAGGWSSRTTSRAGRPPPSPPGAAWRSRRSATFATAAWKRLLFTVIADPPTVLRGCPLEVIGDAGRAALGMDPALETVEVARAEGATLTPQHACDALTWLQGLPRTLPSSMPQGRAAGRPLGHQGPLGPVVRLGRHHGRPTPLTAAILVLLDALPAGGPETGSRTSVTE